MADDGKVKGGHAMIDHLIAGLAILRRHFPDSVQLTETGGWLTVWDWYERRPDVPADDRDKLVRLGWVEDVQAGSWMHTLSN